MNRTTVNKPESEMVLVPREPTEAMLAAADKLIDCDPLWVAKAYRAMVRVALAAASAQAVPSEQPIAEQPQSDKANLMVAVGSDLPPALPYDITVGGNTFHKGVALSTFILAAQHWHRAAFPDGYELTDEEKAANLANLQSCVKDAANTPAVIPDALRAEDQGPLHQPETGKDAARYRWLAPRLMAADFNWNESGKCALVFEWPANVPVGGSCDQHIDAAIALTTKENS